MKLWRETQENLEYASAELTARARARLGSDAEAVEETLAKLRDLVAAIIKLGSQENWQGRPLGVAALYVWSLGRLANAYRLALGGYLSDGLILTRAAFEALWLLIDLDIDAADARGDAEARIDKWMSGEQFVRTGDVIKYAEGAVGERYLLSGFKTS